MPKKLRKMLGDVNSLSAVSLRKLIDTQSKDTIRSVRYEIWIGRKSIGI